MEDKEWLCQECGGEGDIFEVLDNSDGDTNEQVRIYCKGCDGETFYDMPDEERFN